MNFWELFTMEGMKFMKKVKISELLHVLHALHGDAALEFQPEIGLHFSI